LITSLGLGLLALPWPPVQFSRRTLAVHRPLHFVEVGMGHVSDDPAPGWAASTALATTACSPCWAWTGFKRADYDADDPVTIRLRADDLGLDVRTVRLDYRRHGQFGIYAEYDERSARFIDDAVTVYRQQSGHNWPCRPTGSPPRAPPA
jgi:hypothetical protein